MSGIALQPLAEKVQSQLKAAGINVTLAPAPEATELDHYRAGKETMRIWTWGAGYPDPQNYIACAPGEIPKRLLAVIPVVDGLGTMPGTAA